jgi:hypothetical protein
MEDFPVGLKLALCEHLRRPPSGQWVGMARKAGEIIKEYCLTPFVNYLDISYSTTWEPLLDGKKPDKQGIIDMRNFLVHSGRITNQKAASMFGPLLKRQLKK